MNNEVAGIWKEGVLTPAFLDFFGVLPVASGKWRNIIPRRASRRSPPDLSEEILLYASFGANTNAAKTGIMSNPVGFGSD
jgi:hypothetical protein